LLWCHCTHFGWQYDGQATSNTMKAWIIRCLQGLKTWWNKLRNSQHIYSRKANSCRRLLVIPKLELLKQQLGDILVRLTWRYWKMMTKPIEIDNKKRMPDSHVNNNLAPTAMSIQTIVVGWHEVGNLGLHNHKQCTTSLCGRWKTALLLNKAVAAFVQNNGNNY
jgi:hypothetical protein